MRGMYRVASAKSSRVNMFYRTRNLQAVTRSRAAKSGFLIHTDGIVLFLAFKVMMQ